MKSPYFSLALGGGAARGLAHIGVIRRLEELGQKPMAVSGTSMGAIIATLFALGKDSHEMEQIIASIKWSKLIDIDLRKGLIKGKKIEKFLDELFEGKTFADLQIPLVVVATDIDTGECIVFREGKLSEAVRASISIPGVFNPRTVDGRDLVDGGLTCNLPVEYLPQGPVIASSALRDLTRPIRYHRRILGVDWSKTILGNSYSLVQKMIDIVFSQNESRSVQSRGDILYVRSKFDQLDYADFHRYKDFIQAGYTASDGIAGFLACQK